MMVLKATDFLASFNDGKIFPYEKLIHMIYQNIIVGTYFIYNLKANL